MTCSLAPDASANRQATFTESGSLPVCFPALQKQRRPLPLSECRFFAPSFRVRLSSMPVNPAATHSHHPRYPSLAPVRGHCGLSVAALKVSGVIRAARNRRLGCTGAVPGGARSGKRGWCSPFTRRRASLMFRRQPNARWGVPARRNCFGGGGPVETCSHTSARLQRP
jgi:hypothetical protein